MEATDEIIFNDQSDNAINLANGVTFELVVTSGNLTFNDPNDVLSVPGGTISVDLGGGIDPARAGQLSAPGGEISIAAVTNVSVNLLEAGNISVDTGGDILDDNGAAVNIVGTSAQLLGEDIGPGNSIETDLTSLSLDASGTIELIELDLISMDGLRLEAAMDFIQAARGNDITIQVDNGDLNIHRNTFQDVDSATIEATNMVSLDASLGSITRSGDDNGQPDVQAGMDIFLMAQQSIGGDDYLGISTPSLEASAVNGDLFVLSDTFLSVGGALGIDAGSNLYIGADDLIINSTVTAGGKATLDVTGTIFGNFAITNVMAPEILLLAGTDVGDPNSAISVSPGSTVAGSAGGDFGIEGSSITIGTVSLNVPGLNTSGTRSFNGLGPVFVRGQQSASGITANSISVIATDLTFDATATASTVASFDGTMGGISIDAGGNGLDIDAPLVTLGVRNSGQAGSAASPLRINATQLDATGGDLFIVDADAGGDGLSLTNLDGGQISVETLGTLNVDTAVLSSADLDLIGQEVNINSPVSSGGISTVTAQQDLNLNNVFVSSGDAFFTSVTGDINLNDTLTATGQTVCLDAFFSITDGNMSGLNVIADSASFSAIFVGTAAEPIDTQINNISGQASIFNFNHTSPVTEALVCGINGLTPLPSSAPEPPAPTPDPTPEPTPPAPGPTPPGPAPGPNPDPTPPGPGPTPPAPGPSPSPTPGVPPLGELPFSDPNGLPNDANSVAGVPVSNINEITENPLAFVFEPEPGEPTPGGGGASEDFLLTEALAWLSDMPGVEFENEQRTLELYQLEFTLDDANLMNIYQQLVERGWSPVELTEDGISASLGELQLQGSLDGQSLQLALGPNTLSTVENVDQQLLLAAQWLTELPGSQLLSQERLLRPIPI